MSVAEKLIDTTTTAIERTLQAYGLPAVQRGAVREVTSTDVDALVRAPGAVVAVDYEGRVSGSTVLVLGVMALRRIATAMMGADPAGVADDGTPPDELTLSAIAEVGNQALAAASTALGELLEVPVEIGTPTVTSLKDEADATGVDLLATPRALLTTLAVCGEPVHLALLMPTAVFVRVEAALDRGATTAAPTVTAATPEATNGLAAHLAQAEVQLTADVGGAHLTLGDLMALPAGAPLALDQDVDSTVTLRANDQPFAHGQLVVQHGRWAFRITELLPPSTTPTAATPVSRPLPR